jgi:protein SCO1/2/putative membrane protein
MVARLLTAWMLLGALPATPAYGAQDLPYTAGAVEARAPQRFGTLPTFEFTEASGRKVTREDLAGAPWIAVPFFTSCTGPCPQLTADVRAMLHDQLAGTDIKIVSFSVDPEHDTPEVLEAYRASFTADPERWWFVTGDKPYMYAFLRGSLYLSVQEPTQEIADDLGQTLDMLEIAHSTTMVAIDAEGEIAGYYPAGGEQDVRGGLTREQIATSFERLLARVRYLEQGPSNLPLVNASLNGIAFLFLCAGLVAIKRGRRAGHAALMRAAFVSSAAFLACYLYYHTVVLPATGGPTRYNGEGWRRTAYLAMLASHVVLAIVNLPMVLRTLWLAHKERWESHKRWARVTLPIWLYVSVTGVAVYLVLYHWNPAAALPS